MQAQMRNEPNRAFSSAGSEHLPYKQRVGGSNPSLQAEGRRFESVNAHLLKQIGQISPFGRLAQLVQSICLTSRGSAVRIRQRPLTLLLFSSKLFPVKGKQVVCADRVLLCAQFYLLFYRGAGIRYRCFVKIPSLGDEGVFVKR